MSSWVDATSEIGKRVLAADAAVLLLVCALLCYGIPSSTVWRRGRPAIICDLRHPHHGLSVARRLSFSPSRFLSVRYLVDHTCFRSLRCICSGAGAGHRAMRDREGRKRGRAGGGRDAVGVVELRRE